MTSYPLSRREVLGATTALAGLALAGVVSCGRDRSGAGDQPLGLTGMPLIRAELARLLETDCLPMEAGYRALEDGMIVIAAIHHVPDVKGAMIEWWLRRMKTDEEFRMWHPDAHVHWEWDDKLNVEIAHHLRDGEITKGKVQARDASDYFDTSRFAEHGISAAVCSRMGLVDRDGWVGHVVHLCRDTSYGCEVRTRLFLGDFDPMPSALLRPVLLALITEENARWFVRHMSEEYLYLSRFLPGMYRREVG